MQKSLKFLIIWIPVCLLLVISIVAFFYIKEKIWRDRQIRIAREKCNEYVKFACDHQNEIISNKTSAIILGEDAPITMLPHMASLVIWSENDKENLTICGGSLISEYFVLSAAHCIHDVENYQVAIKLGTATPFDGDTGEWFGASEFYMHPEYKDVLRPHDMLLIKLDRKVNFSKNVRPICLNTKFNPKYDPVIASGWGQTEYSFHSPQLKMVELQMFKTKRCEKIKNRLRNPNLICALDANSSKSAHQGDSGGPLQIRLNTCANIYEIIGVTHAVQNRDLSVILNWSLYSLYTKVEPYILWIASIVWSDEP